MFSFWKRKPILSDADGLAIVPRIKHISFSMAAEQTISKVDDTPVTEPLAADLLISYAFDMPVVFRAVSRADLARCSLDMRKLRHLAIVNLQKKIHGIRLDGEPPVQMLVTGDDLEACTLLLDEYWTELSEQTCGSLVVAAPTQGIVLVGNLKSDLGLRVMHEACIEARAREPERLLSECLLAWREGRWETL